MYIIGHVNKVSHDRGISYVPVHLAATLFKSNNLVRITEELDDETTIQNHHFDKIRFAVIVGALRITLPDDSFFWCHNNDEVFEVDIVWLSLAKHSVDVSPLVSLKHLQLQFFLVVRAKRDRHALAHLIHSIFTPMKSPRLNYLKNAVRYEKSVGSRVSKNWTERTVRIF